VHSASIIIDSIGTTSKVQHKALGLLTNPRYRLRLADWESRKVIPDVDDDPADLSWCQVWCRSEVMF
jgi:hypothetical protein